MTMLLVSCSELKKHSFLEFYDHYTSTARKLSAKLEGQQMIVSSGRREEWDGRGRREGGEGREEGLLIYWPMKV